MKRSSIVAVNCCILMVRTAEAATRELPKKVLPARAGSGVVRQLLPVKPAPLPKRKTLTLPPTGSKLSAKPRPKQPSVASSGRLRPDNRSIGLADQRLRANDRAPQFTLEDAIALCLANNPRRDEAQAAVNAATANINVAGSRGKFQVGLNGTTEYGRNTSTSNSIATAASSGGGGGNSSGNSGGNSDGGSGQGSGNNSGGGAGQGNGSTASPSPSRSFLRFDQLEVNASLPITTGGAVKASTRQARYQAVAQIYQLAQVEQDLILATTLAYLDVLRSQQLLRVANANLSVSQERLRIARLRFGVGASAQLDVLQAETAIADARSRRIQAVNAVGINNSDLNILLGRSPESPIRLAPITRLNLPNVAYTVKPTSVLTAPNRGTAPTRGGSATGNSTGESGNSNPPSGTGPLTSSGNMGRTGASGSDSVRSSVPNQTSTRTGAARGAGAGSASTPGAVFSGPSAPAGSGSSSSSQTGVGGASGMPSPSSGPSVLGSTTGTPGRIGSTSGTGLGSSSTGGSSASGNSTGASTSASAVNDSSTGSASSSLASLGTGAVSSDASAGLQSLAGGTRQSLAVTTAQIGAAQAAVDIAKAGKKPQLGLNIGALLRNPATFLGNFGASIGLGLAQNLFDSGRTRNQVDSARAALEQLKARLEGQRLEVAGAIETSLLTLDSAQRRQDNSLAGVNSAREALRVAQIGFRSGVRTTLDLANAQASLLSAETDAVNSRFDLASAQATLAAAVGIYTVEAQNARERSIPAKTDPANQAGKQIEILDPKPKKKRRKFLGIF